MPGPDDALNTFFDGMDMAALEDFYRLGHLEVPKRDVPLGEGEPRSSPKRVKQFSASSVDPGCKRTVVLTIPANSQSLLAPVGVANYLQCLVTKEDQEKMNKLGTSSLFNDAQQALNRVRHFPFVLLRESYFVLDVF